MSQQIIAVTGHRPDKLFGYGPQAQHRLNQFAIAHIPPADLYITGMALGWDQAVAVACMFHNIPFYAYVPFKGQEARWPLADKSEYCRLLDAASKIIYVCDPGYAAWKMQRRNESMVDACSTLLALWNGTPSGTGSCVAYAHSKQVPVINLWSKFTT